MITVANFGSAILDLPIASSANDTDRVFAANTDKIPPLGTEVLLAFSRRPGQAECKARSQARLEPHEPGSGRRVRAGWRSPNEGIQDPHQRRRRGEVDRRPNQPARERGDRARRGLGTSAAREISSPPGQSRRSIGPPWMATPSVPRKPSAPRTTCRPPSGASGDRGRACAARRPSAPRRPSRSPPVPPLPSGADAVVPVESTRVDGDQVLVSEAVPHGRNVGRRSEDIAPGAVVLRAGRAIRPQDLGVLGRRRCLPPGRCPPPPRRRHHHRRRAARSRNARPGFPDRGRQFRDDRRLGRPGWRLVRGHRTPRRQSGGNPRGNPRCRQPVRPDPGFGR